MLCVRPMLDTLFRMGDVVSSVLSTVLAIGAARGEASSVSEISKNSYESHHKCSH